MSLPTELRRDVEIELIRAYWSRLCASGSAEDPNFTESYPFEVCLCNFQLGLVYTFRT